MARTNVAQGGRTSFQDTMQAVNQSVGQMMTFIQQDKQLKEMEATRRQQRWTADFASTPEQATLNATNRNPGYMFGLKEFYGLDDKTAETYASSVSKMALLPEQQGALYQMQAWEKLKEGDTSYVFALNELSAQAGIDTAVSKDQLAGGFKPTSPYAGQDVQAARGTNTPSGTPPAEIPPEEEVVVEPPKEVVPQLGADDPTRPGGVVLPGEKTTAPAIFKPEFATAGPRRDPITGAVIPQAGEDIQKGLEQPAGVVLPTAQKEAEVSGSPVEEVNKIQKEENFFRIEEVKTEKRNEIRANLNLNLSVIEQSLQRIRPDARNENNREYMNLIQKKRGIISDMQRLDLQSKAQPGTPLFFQLGNEMRRDITYTDKMDSGSLKGLRALQEVSMNSYQKLSALKVVPGKEQEYLLSEFKRTLPDKAFKDIETLFSYRPVGPLQSQADVNALGREVRGLPGGEAAARARGRAAGGLTPAEKVRGQGAVISLFTKETPKTDLENLRDNIKNLDPAVMGAYFPDIFNRQIQLNDQELRRAQLKINDKIANTQSYQVQMTAYYQGLQDQIGDNNPAMGMLFEGLSDYVMKISQGFDYTDPKTIEKQINAAMKSDAIYATGVNLIARLNKETFGSQFTTEEITKGIWLWKKTQNVLRSDPTQGFETTSGYDAGAVTHPGGFTADAELEGLLNN